MGGQAAGVGDVMPWFVSFAFGWLADLGLAAVLVGWLADLWFVPALVAAGLWLYARVVPGRLAAWLVDLLVAALAALAVWMGLSSALASARSAGVAAERAVWVDRVDREERRQDDANARAIAAARAEVTQLREREDALATLLEDLDHEATLAPARDAVALPADSVRRIAAVGRSGRCEARAATGGTGRADRRPGSAACRAMTVAEVEDGWRRDRATIVEAQRRTAALGRFYAARDAGLRGGPLWLGTD